MCFHLWKQAWLPQLHRMYTLGRKYIDRKYVRMYACH